MFEFPLVGRGSEERKTTARGWYIWFFFSSPMATDPHYLSTWEWDERNLCKSITEIVNCTAFQSFLVRLFAEKKISRSWNPWNHVINRVSFVPSWSHYLCCFLSIAVLSEIDLRTLPNSPQNPTANRSTQPLFSVKYLFGEASICTWPFHSCNIFEAYFYMKQIPYDFLQFNFSYFTPPRLGYFSNKTGFLKLSDSLNVMERGIRKILTFVIS